MRPIWVEVPRWREERKKKPFQIEAPLPRGRTGWTSVTTLKPFFFFYELTMFDLLQESWTFLISKQALGRPVPRDQARLRGRDLPGNPRVRLVPSLGLPCSS